MTQRKGIRAAAQGRLRRMTQRKTVGCVKKVYNKWVEIVDGKFDEMLLPDGRDINYIYMLVSDILRCPVALPPMRIDSSASA